jgi:hypothetical protein
MGLMRAVSGETMDVLRLKKFIAMDQAAMYLMAVSKYNCMEILLPLFSVKLLIYLHLFFLITLIVLFSRYPRLSNTLKVVFLIIGLLIPVIGSLGCISWLFFSFRKRNAGFTG